MLTTASVLISFTLKPSLPRMVIAVVIAVCKSNFTSISFNTILEFAGILREFIFTSEQAPSSNYLYIYIIKNKKIKIILI